MAWHPKAKYSLFSFARESRTPKEQAISSCICSPMWSRTIMWCHGCCKFPRRISHMMSFVMISPVSKVVKNFTLVSAEWIFCCHHEVLSRACMPFNHKLWRKVWLGKAAQGRPSKKRPLVWRRSLYGVFVFYADHLHDNHFVWPPEWVDHHLSEFRIFCICQNTEKFGKCPFKGKKSQPLSNCCSCWCSRGGGSNCD